MTGASFSLHQDFYLAFDLHGYVERQFCHADRAARVSADLGSVEFEYEIGESVDHARLLVEAGSAIDHSKDSAPGRNAIEIAQRTLETAEDGQRCQPGGCVALLDCEFFAELPERVS